MKLFLTILTGICLSFENQVRFELLNYLGRKLKEGKVVSNEIKTIYLDNELSSGVYFLLFYNEKNEILKMKRMVVQK